MEIPKVIYIMDEISYVLQVRYSPSKCRFAYRTKRANLKVSAGSLRANMS